MAKLTFKTKFLCSSWPFSLLLLFLDPSIEILLCPLILVIHAGSPPVCQKSDSSSLFCFLVADGVAGRHVWWVARLVSKDCVGVAKNMCALSLCSVLSHDVKHDSSRCFHWMFPRHQRSLELTFTVSPCMSNLVNTKNPSISQWSVLPVCIV